MIPMIPMTGVIATVLFGLAASLNPSDASAPLTRLDIGITNPPSSSGYHPLSVQLIGGSARACDPAAKSTEPRACL